MELHITRHGGLPLQVVFLYRVLSLSTITEVPKLWVYDPAMGSDLIFSDSWNWQGKLGFVHQELNNQIPGVGG